MKQLISMIVFMSVAMVAAAQTNYYSDKEYLKLKDVTYKIEHENDDPYYRIYDSISVFANKPLMRRDGTIHRDMTYAVPIQDWKKLFKDAVYEAFTDAEIRGFGEEELGITLYINSDTGRIDELMFSIYNKSPLLLRTLVPEKLRALELKIKSGLTFNVHESVRKILPILKIYHGIYFSHIPSRTK